MSKLAIHTFGGYANAQLRRLENKALRTVSQEKQEELSKCIIEQQKTTGSLIDLIYELKAQIGKM